MQLDVVNGPLQTISPDTKVSSQTRQPVYEGRVPLQRDHYTVVDSAYPLRYGMTAAAEIVARTWRLIDMALDPFRQIGG